MGKRSSSCAGTKTAARALFPREMHLSSGWVRAANNLSGVDLDLMKSGQSGYKLVTHGGRVPIPGIIGTEGWAMFFHQPCGTFDLRGPEAKFTPTSTSAKLPLDLFFTTAQDPATIMSEYARLTGLPEMPPLWSLGYQQSHRTLAGREEVLGVAKTFREKKLPCDALIYLGTGFCPSGWNTENGSFVWNSSHASWALPWSLSDRITSCVIE